MKPTLSAPSGAIFFQILLLSALAGLAFYFDHSENPSSPDVARVAHWAVTSRDHGGHPFAVVDKPQARLFAFDADGRLRGSTPVRVERNLAGDDTKTGLSMQVEDGFYREHFGPSAWQVRVAYFLQDGGDAEFALQRGQPRRPS